MGLTPDDRIRLARYAGSIAYFQELSWRVKDRGVHILITDAVDVGNEYAQLLESVGPARLKAAELIASAIVENYNR